jgi:hypothetical protein
MDGSAYKAIACDEIDHGTDIISSYYPAGQQTACTLRYLAHNVLLTACFVRLSVGVGVLAISPNVIPLGVPTAVTFTTGTDLASGAIAIAADCSKIVLDPTVAFYTRAFTSTSPTLSVTISRVGGPYRVCVSIAPQSDVWVDQTLAFSIAGESCICELR